MRASFLCLKCDNFACLHTRQDQNELHLKRRFFAKIGSFCTSICRNIFQRCSSVYTIVFVRRKNKTNYLSNQTGVWFWSTSWKKTLDCGPYRTLSNLILWNAFLNMKSSQSSKLCVDLLDERWRIKCKEAVFWQNLWAKMKNGHENPLVRSRLCINLSSTT